MRQDPLCETCRQELAGKIRTSSLELFQRQIKVTYCYIYSEQMGNYMFRFKGNGDIRLSTIFLLPFQKALQKQFKEYVLIRMPSWHEDDEKRGFNHVHEIFSMLDLPIYCPLIKTRNEKQSQHSKKERQKATQFIELNQNFDHQAIAGKKILLVDDVMTTGHTLLRAAQLLQISEVTILVVAMHELLSKKGD